MDNMTGAGWVELGSFGSGTKQFSNPHGIFVASTGQNLRDRLRQQPDCADGYRRMTGAGWTTLAFGTSGSGTKQLPMPHGIFVGHGISGKIYVIDAGNARIVRMDDMTGAGWTTFGTSGSGANQFSMPHGIFVDTAGKIYVADPSNSRIVRIDNMTGRGLGFELGTLGNEDNQFNGPRGVFLR